MATRSLRTLQSKVQKSAKILDVDFPGWHNKIDLAKFTIGSTDNCIVGQLDKRHYANQEIFDKARGVTGEHTTLDLSFERGFWIPGSVDIKATTKQLENMWRFQIAKRKRCDEKKKIDAMFRC